MSDLQRLLDRAALDPRRELDLDAVIRRAGQLDRRARLARVGGGLAVLAVVGSAAFAATRPDTERVTVGAEPTTTTATTSAVLAPADTQTPAAGTCLPADGPVATVTLSPDVPQPRCVVVKPEQRLDLVNPGQTAVTATLGAQTIIVPAGQTGRIDLAFGDYLEPGVHRLDVAELYASSSPEIWLP